MVAFAQDVGAAQKMVRHSKCITRNIFKVDFRGTILIDCAKLYAKVVMQRSMARFHPKLDGPTLEKKT